MVMSVIVIVLVALVAYIHYVQGMFSATLSAILAIISAMLAFSYQEVLVRAFMYKAGDAATALSIVMLFVVIYLVLRVIFDSAVPGNVRVPVVFDKVGAGLMGAVAGVFMVGVLLTATESLAFGPSIAGYSRYQLIDSVDAKLPSRRGQSLDSEAYDVLDGDRIADATPKRLILPVDDMVVNLVEYLSNGGSLAGTRTVESVHPAYLDELFFQRLGIQTGATHVAYNIPGSPKAVDVKGLYAPPGSLPQADGEATWIEQRWQTHKLEPVLKQDADGKLLLIATVFFSRNAADGKDNLVRVSPAAVRLQIGGKNYLPIGNIDGRSGLLVRANRPDDFLLIKADSNADLVYHVPLEDLNVASTGGAITMPAGSFIEAKRFGVVDLSGQTVKREVPPVQNDGIQRKKDLPAAQAGA